MKRFLLCCLALWLVATAVPTMAAVDPFYRNRMESGIRAFELGNWDEASRELRIACFGYLDEPAALVRGLVRLGLVESARGDREAFRRVFSRIADVEEKLSGYSQAQLPEGLRGPFEEAVVRLVPAQRLRSVAAFRGLADRAQLERLAALPRQARRSELEKRLQAEPGRPDVLVELARLELETRRPSLALDLLDRLPASVAGQPRATCLRQQAATEAESCERMDLERPFCAGVLDSVIEFRLECLVEAGRWPEAAELVAGLPAETREKRRIARLERRIERQSPVDTGDPAAAAAEPPAAASAPAAPAESVASPATGPADPAAPAPRGSPAPNPIDPARLQRLRERLAAATSAEQLASLMTETERLARDHPTSRAAQLLAAEIAYLSSDWAQSVAFFRRAGDMRPREIHLAFYLAVALYETGEAQAAAEVLRPIASRLERTRFVGAYIDRILSVGGPTAPPGI